MVGRSDEVTQNFLSVAPSVGSAANPDVEKIKSYATDIVFADDTLDENAKKELTDAGIMVLNVASPETTTELETVYLTLGKILGGSVDGAKTGEDSYKDLIDTMKTYKAEVNSNVSKTICYLYLEGDKLHTLHSGTYGDMLLGYTGAVNAAVNISDNNVDVATLKIANPNFIFYADKATLDKIKGDTTLASLGAVKTGKILEVSLEEMSRPGNTALEALEKMVYFMYPDLKPKSATDTTKAQDATASKTDATTATQATTTASDSKSVADKYNLTITSDLSLKLEDENDTVKAMQLRLYNIGYIADKDNVTGYYGEVTAEAVKKFQKNNGLKETGTADNATLVLLFDSSAKKAK